MTTTCTLPFSDRLAMHLAPHGEQTAAGHASQSLDVRIAARFFGASSIRDPLRFSGSMRLHCSWFGALLARVLRRYSLLPGVCATDVPMCFEINHAGDALTKERRYQLNAQHCFCFRSRFFHEPSLGEEFSPHFGMYLRLISEPNRLWFVDNGYFIKLFGQRWKMPSVCSPRFELLHENVGNERFRVTIRVSHALLGTLFHQCGTFAASSSSVDTPRI
jgi:hypothetical protein